MESLQTLELDGGYALRILDSDRGQVLRLTGPDPETTWSILLRAEGPVLDLHSAGLTLKTDGAFAIDAQKVAIHGREGVSISSDADLCFRAAGDLESRGRIQTITADLGDVQIRANDDVRLNGERIRMNC